MPDGGAAAGGLPSTRVDAAGEAQPETSLIVKHDGAHWLDELRRTWDHVVPFTLPDKKDVFVIDAMANPPAPLPGTGGYFSGVGTVLFNMIVNPASGHVYVANTEALNQRRFVKGRAYVSEGITLCKVTCTKAVSQCLTKRASSPVI